MQKPLAFSGHLHVLATVLDTLHVISFKPQQPNELYLHFPISDSWEATELWLGGAWI